MPRQERNPCGGVAGTRFTRSPAAVEVRRTTPGSDCPGLRPARRAVPLQLNHDHIPLAVYTKQVDRLAEVGWDLTPDDQKRTVFELRSNKGFEDLGPGARADEYRDTMLQDEQDEQDHPMLG